MARVSVGALVLLVGAACDEPEVPQPPPAESTLVEPQAEPPEPPETAEVPQPEEAPIGIDTLAPPSRAARRANREALEAHRAGDYEASLEGFDRAAQESAGYRNAHFNRACALARLGRLDESAAAMERLLHEDLPDFRERLESDEDLTALRESEHGARLRTVIEGLDERYGEAIARGVQAYTFRPRASWANDAPRFPVSDLRIGVYDPATRRFVPVAPRVPDAQGGAIVRDERAVIQVAASMSSGTCGHHLPKPRRASVHDLTHPGVAVFALDSFPTDMVASGGEVAAFSFSGGREGLHAISHWIDNARSEHQVFDIDRVGRVSSRFDAQATRSALLIHGDGLGGTVPYPHPEGFRLRGRRLTLPSGDDVEVAHHGPATLHRSPDGDRLLILSAGDGCDEDEGAETDVAHAAILVDLSTRSSTVLSRGVGPALVAARFGPDSTLYLQVGDTVRRYPPGSTEPIDDVPEGVHLETPNTTSYLRVFCEC